MTGRKRFCPSFYNISFYLTELLAVRSSDLVQLLVVSFICRDIKRLYSANRKSMRCCGRRCSVTLITMLQVVEWAAFSGSMW